jgi:hypothetical protein
MAASQCSWYYIITARRQFKSVVAADIAYGGKQLQLDDAEVVPLQWGLLAAAMVCQL